MTYLRMQCNSLAIVPNTNCAFPSLNDAFTHFNKIRIIFIHLYYYYYNYPFSKERKSKNFTDRKQKFQMLIYKKKKFSRCRSCRSRAASRRVYFVVFFKITINCDQSLRRRWIFFLFYLNDILSLYYYLVTKERQIFGLKMSFGELFKYSKTQRLFFLFNLFFSF